LLSGSHVAVRVSPYVALCAELAQFVLRKGFAMWVPPSAPPAFGLVTVPR
jgi:hypothetical protein